MCHDNKSNACIDKRLSLTQLYYLIAAESFVILAMTLPQRLEDTKNLEVLNKNVNSIYLKFEIPFKPLIIITLCLGDFVV